MKVLLVAALTLASATFAKADDEYRGFHVWADKVVVSSNVVVGAETGELGLNITVNDEWKTASTTFRVEFAGYQVCTKHMDTVKAREEAGQDAYFSVRIIHNQKILVSEWIPASAYRCKEVNDELKALDQ